MKKEGSLKQCILLQDATKRTLHGKGQPSCVPEMRGPRRPRHQPLHHHAGLVVPLAAVALLLLVAANTLNYHANVAKEPALTRFDDDDDAQHAPPVARVAAAHNNPAARERCFDGARHERIKGLHGAAEFAVSFQLKTRPNACRPMAYGGTRQWHASGCGVISGVRGFLRDRTEWWVKRRERPPLGPREDFAAPRGGGVKEHLRRDFLEEVFATGARSDFGVSLEADDDGAYRGRVLFGVGHRDFGEHALNHGVLRQSARPVRDVTFAAEAPSLTDGNWHDIVVVRSRRRPQLNGAVQTEDEIPVAASLHDTSELHVYVDGKRAAGSFRLTGGKTGAAMANDASQKSGGLPGGAFAGLPHALHDAPVNVTLGDAFKGCLRHMTFHTRALDAVEVKKGAQQLAVQPIAKTSTRYPLYFYSHDDEGSRAMRDKFVRSIRDPSTDIELRELVLGAGIEDQTQRFGTKIDLILKAIEENQPGTYVLISDVDIRFFKPVKPYIDAIATGDYDIVFQRDEDRSLQGNLGFMAIRCSQQVGDLWRIAGGVVTQKRRGSTGDQRIVNRALAEPSFYGAPRLRWTLFPPELATDIFADALTRDAMYGTGYNEWVLFHANRYGRAGNGASRARVAKMNLLAYAEALRQRRLQVAGAAPPYKVASFASLAPDAPQTRWQHLDTKGSPLRRRFPRDTEGG